MSGDMTTPSPIPPEALDGKECLIDIGHSRFIATYYPDNGEWFVTPGTQIIPHSLVVAVVPIPVCLAAPGMREALKEALIICEDFAHSSATDTAKQIRTALAACENGKTNG